MSDFNPKWVSKPSNTILDILKEKKILLEDFLKFMGPNYKMDDFVDVNTAIKLADILGGSVQFWLKRDKQFREGLLQGKKIV